MTALPGSGLTAGPTSTAEAGCTRATFRPKATITTARKGKNLPVRTMTPLRRNSSDDRQLDVNVRTPTVFAGQAQSLFHRPGSGARRRRTAARTPFPWPGARSDREPPAVQIAQFVVLGV